MQQRRRTKPIAFIQQDPVGELFDKLLALNDTAKEKYARYRRAINTGVPVYALPPETPEETKYDTPIEIGNTQQEVSPSAVDKFNMGVTPKNVNPSVLNTSQFVPAKPDPINSEYVRTEAGPRTTVPYTVNTTPGQKATLDIGKKDSDGKPQGMSGGVTPDEYVPYTVPTQRLTPQALGNPYGQGTYNERRYNELDSAVNGILSSQSLANNINDNRAKAAAGALREPVIESRQDLASYGMSPQQIQQWIKTRGLPSKDNPQKIRLVGDFKDLTDLERSERARMGLGTAPAENNWREQADKDYIAKFGNRSLTTPEFMKENRNPTRTGNLQARAQGVGVTARDNGLYTPAGGYDKVGQGYRVAPPAQSVQPAQVAQRTPNLQDNKPLSEPALGTKPKPMKNDNFNNGFFTT